MQDVPTGPVDGRERPEAGPASLFDADREWLEKVVGKPHSFRECCCLDCVFWAKYGRQVEQVDPSSLFL